MVQRVQASGLGKWAGGRAASAGGVWRKAAAAAVFAFAASGVGAQTAAASVIEVQAGDTFSAAARRE